MRASAPSPITLPARRLVNSPQRKWTACFKARIDTINEIKSAVVARADEWLFFPEGEGIKRASKLPKHDLDDDQIFVAFFIDGENFGYDGRHLWRSIGLNDNKNDRPYPWCARTKPRTQDA
jgi:hypothetical protein